MTVKDDGTGRLGGDNARRNSDLIPASDTYRRYTDLIKLAGMKGRYIDQEKEHQLLEQGVMSFDLSLKDAARVLRKTAEDHGFVFASQESRRVEQLMARHAGRTGGITREQFESSAQILRDFSEKSIGEAEARRQLKKMMLEHGWQPRRSVLTWSRKWFEQVKV